MRNIRTKSLFLVLVGALMFSACGGEDDKPDTTPADTTAGGSDTNSSVDGGGGEDVTADTGPVVVEPPKEAFWVLYGRRSRVPGSTKNNDLVLTDAKNPGAIENASTYGMGISPLGDKGKALELTKFSFKKSGGLNCNYGCILSQDFKYIAIATGPPSTKGFEFQLGTLNDSLEVFVGKFGKLTDVADLHFRGATLYYTTPKKCFDTGKCQYSVMRRKMDGSEVEKELGVMPPANDPDVLSTPPHTIYTGRFHVSEGGDTLVFLTPTIRSVKVYAWRGGNLTQLDYVCENKVDENTCVGTGSQYNDNDGVGISPDGKTVVMFTIVGKNLRARKYFLESTKASQFSNMVTVPGNNYKASVCLNLKPWQHAQVKGQPVFSADGKTVYFHAFSDCAGGTEKPWTDIMSIDLDKIGGLIGEKDLVNWTNNPREHSPQNREIYSFTISPDKKYFIFNATPTYGSTGDALPASDKRHEKDTEIYTMAIQAGAEMVQITNETAYATDAPAVFKPVEVQ